MTKDSVMRNLIIDCDIGTDVDDILALFLAIASPHVNILGIIATGQHANLRGAHAKKIVSMAGCSVCLVSRDSFVTYRTYLCISVVVKVWA